MLNNETRLRARLDRGKLLAAITRTYDATTKKGKTLALGCFLLTLDKSNQMLVEATDLEISISDPCPVLDAESFGRILIPAAAFRDIIKRLPDDEVELLELDNFRLEIRAGESLSRLAGYDPADFPTIPTAKGEASRVWAADLQEIASAVGHAVCTDETKFSLLGVRAQWVEDSEGGGVLVGIATDGHRLALAGKRLDDPAPLFADGVTIPSKGIEAIKKLEGVLSICLSGGMLHIVQGELCLAIRLLDHTYPDARKVIPEDYSAVLSVNAGVLLAAVDRVRLLATKNVVLLDLQGETLIIKAESERGDSLDAVPVVCEGPDLTIRLDARYLLDAVGSLGGGEIFIKYQDGASPLLLLPAELSGFDERVLVLMPRNL